MSPPAAEVLLEVRNLRTHFKLRQGIVRSVDGVDLTIYRGQTLGVVGESGCGKSVTAQSILRIVPHPGEIVGGQILLYGEAGGEPVDLATLPPKGQRIREVRGGEIGMIFQEPMASLSPVHTVGNQIIEMALLHREGGQAEARGAVLDMLGRVGFSEPERTFDSYPHELSGGMRQRAVIAMALVGRPSLLIADEPTTALDVTTEAQILRLLKRLQADLGMAIMFITHDLGVIAKMADHAAVMYLGKVVEHSDVDALFHDAQAPLPARPAVLGAALRRQRAGAAGLDRGHRARPVPAAGRLPVPPALPGIDCRPLRGGGAGVPHLAGGGAPRRVVPPARAAG